MTTICAIKKGKRLCIASDNLTCFGARKEILGKHVYDDGKIIQIGQNHVGIAGHPSWELILKRYFPKKKMTPNAPKGRSGDNGRYLDKDGNPVPDGSDKSHLYPPEGTSWD